MSEEENKEIKEELEDLDELDLYGRITGVRMGHIRERSNFVSDVELINETGAVVGHLAIPFERTDRIGATFSIKVSFEPMEGKDFYKIVSGDKPEKKETLPYIG
jgi:hypothetical protein